MPKISDRLIRVAATAAHRLLKAFWFLRRPRTYGAHAVALTPQNRIVLVRLRYAAGWRLPGGGRSADEPARDAALRELREEIGMTAHGEVTLACELEETTDFKHDCASILIVRDVAYRPRRWSWEVEKVCEAPLDRLPSGMSPLTARWLRTIQPHL